MAMPASVVYRPKEEKMRLRVTLLTAVLLSLVLGAGNTAVRQQPTAIATNAPTKVVASATDAITIPGLLSYQGKLTDTAGRPIPNGIYAVTFSLYAESTGGAAFWTELQNVQTRSGLFNVQLGTVTPLISLPEDGNCYLEMQVHPDPVMTRRIRIVSAAYAYLTRKADTANYALAGGTPSPWVRGSPDSVLYTVRQLGIARGGADNMLYGPSQFTHVNLGVACTTGTSGQDRPYCTVGGGGNNTASGYGAIVGGGQANTASGYHATVAGGGGNSASGSDATVGGGGYNSASEWFATVAGGTRNSASGEAATVAGGYNKASGDFATVAGGGWNVAAGAYSTVGGGLADTSAADHSFTTNLHSLVPSSYSNSAAFNGQTATASSQLRCGALSKASGTFTIDHPLDPYGKILNHYFIEGPEMRNIYDGEAILDASGRAVVTLPDYFDALNRKPRVQLTGVGRSDVYVAEKVSGNRFTIGGSPGTEVYWQVTGERKDVSAEATRRMMPVEQPKTGGLAGRMLDDDFLVGCMEQLVREGRAAGINFRTAAGRQRYEDMKRRTSEKQK
jgi:hypothetical protein